MSASIQRNTACHLTKITEELKAAVTLLDEPSGKVAFSRKMSDFDILSSALFEHETFQLPQIRRRSDGSVEISQEAQCKYQKNRRASLQVTEFGKLRTKRLDWKPSQSSKTEHYRSADRKLSACQQLPDNDSRYDSRRQSVSENALFNNQFDLFRKITLNKGRRCSDSFLQICVGSETLIHPERAKDPKSGRLPEKWYTFVKELKKQRNNGGEIKKEPVRVESTENSPYTEATHLAEPTTSATIIPKQSRSGSSKISTIQSSISETSDESLPSMLIPRSEMSAQRSQCRTPFADSVQLAEIISLKKVSRVACPETNNPKALSDFKVKPLAPIKSKLCPVEIDKPGRIIDAEESENEPGTDSEKEVDAEKKIYKNVEVCPVNYCTDEIPIDVERTELDKRNGMTRARSRSSLINSDDNGRLVTSRRNSLIDAASALKQRNNFGNFIHVPKNMSERHEYKPVGMNNVSTTNGDKNTATNITQTRFSLDVAKMHGRHSKARFREKNNYPKHLAKFLKDREKELPTSTLLEIKRLRELRHA